MPNFPHFFALKALALASVALLGACSSNNNPSPTPAASTYATTWTIGSTNYTATASSATLTSNNTVLSVIAAQVNGNDQYAVSFNVPPATGTYNLATGTGLTTGGGYTTTVGGTTTSYGVYNGYGGTGTVTVSTFSATEVSGTFSMTPANATTPNGPAVTVSNGKFSIKR